jgi:spermidine/putrescine transport system substrate-binding protein
MTDDQGANATGDIPIALLRGLVSRRRVLQMGGLSALGVAMAGCGTPAALQTISASEQAAKDLSATEKVVNWSNWPEYIDIDDKTKKYPTLDEFTKSTGIKVNYTEDYNDNDEFFAKIKPQMSANRSTGRDVWCSTDWMVARLMRLNWVQKLDKANIPNWKNLQDNLVDVEYDKGRVYSIPWQSGFTGIAYNPGRSGTDGEEIKTVTDLLTNKKIHGKVTMLTEMRDTVGLTMLDMHIDPADFGDKDYEAVIKRLTKVRDSGQLRGFTGNEYGSGLANGTIAACVAWTGDVVQLQADKPNLGYELPATGHMIWSDNFVIPNQAEHKTNAEKLINYYYEPEVMALVEDYVNYISPVKGSGEILAKDDPDVANNPLIFPSEAVLAKSHVFKGLTAEKETKYNGLFQALIGG